MKRRFIEKSSRPQEGNVQAKATYLANGYCFQSLIAPRPPVPS
jgi:glycyl-tRNA synthetase alpha subunit